MKAVLEFNLPEESEEHLNALNGVKYRAVLDELDNELREQWKYQDKQLISIEEVRSLIRELKDEYNINE